MGAEEVSRLKDLRPRDWRHAPSLRPRASAFPPSPSPSPSPSTLAYSPASLVRQRCSVSRAAMLEAAG